MDVLESKWLEPARSDKKRSPKSAERQRHVLGEKGVGRFAAAKLAPRLRLVSRERASPFEAVLSVEWDRFQEDRYLDDVSIVLEEATPSVVTRDGLLNSLFTTEIHDQDYRGTLLELHGLYDVWDSEELDELTHALSRLISPVLRAQLDAAHDEFDVFLTRPGELRLPHMLPLPLAPPEAIRHPHYALRAIVSDDGQAVVNCTVGGTSESSNRPLEHWNPKIGGFEIDLFVWDRDNLDDLARTLGVGVRNIRSDLNSASGVSIFRDGFRVLPYGESGNDWLSLDARRVQNPTMRLSNNQVVGSVRISKDHNAYLRDQSNREGIQSSREFADFRTCVLECVAEIERRRYDHRQSQKLTEPESTAKPASLFEIPSFDELRGAAAAAGFGGAELVSVIDLTERRVQERLSEIRAVLAQYHKLAALGQLVDVVLHDGRNALNVIDGRMQLLLSQAKLPRPDIEKVRTHADAAIVGANALGSLFRRIEPFGGRKRGRPKRTAMESAIRTSQEMHQQRLDEHGISVSLPATETEVTADATELQLVFSNLFDNSIFWLTRPGHRERRIDIEVARHSEHVEVLFSDSGPGVAPADRPYIFHPYFSTRPNGSGLGLAIVGSIVADYYDGTVELVEGNSSGAVFRLTFRRRV